MIDSNYIYDKHLHRHFISENLAKHILRTNYGINSVHHSKWNFHLYLTERLTIYSTIIYQYYFYWLQLNPNIPV